MEENNNKNDEFFYDKLLELICGKKKDNAKNILKSKRYFCVNNAIGRNKDTPEISIPIQYGEDPNDHNYYPNNCFILAINSDLKDSNSFSFITDFNYSEEEDRVDPLFLGIFCDVLCGRTAKSEKTEQIFNVETFLKVYSGYRDKDVEAIYGFYGILLEKHFISQRMLNHVKEFLEKIEKNPDKPCKFINTTENYKKKIKEAKKAIENYEKELAKMLQEEKEEEIKENNIINNINIGGKNETINEIKEKNINSFVNNGNIEALVSILEKISQENKENKEKNKKYEDATASVVNKIFNIIDISNDGDTLYVKCIQNLTYILKETDLAKDLTGEAEKLLTGLKQYKADRDIALSLQFDEFKRYRGEHTSRSRKKKSNRKESYDSMKQEFIEAFKKKGQELSKRINTTNKGNNRTNNGTNNRIIAFNKNKKITLQKDNFDNTDDTIGNLFDKIIKLRNRQKRTMEFLTNNNNNMSMFNNGVISRIKEYNNKPQSKKLGNNKKSKFKEMAQIAEMSNAYNDLFFDINNINKQNNTNYNSIQSYRSNNYEAMFNQLTDNGSNLNGLMKLPVNKDETEKNRLTHSYNLLEQRKYLPKFPNAKERRTSMDNKEFNANTNNGIDNLNNYNNYIKGELNKSKNNIRMSNSGQFNQNPTMYNNNLGSFNSNPYNSINNNNINNQIPLGSFSSSINPYNIINNSQMIPLQIDYYNQNNSNYSQNNINNFNPYSNSNININNNEPSKEVKKQLREIFNNLKNKPEFIQETDTWIPKGNNIYVKKFSSGCIRVIYAPNVDDKNTGYAMEKYTNGNIYEGYLQNNSREGKGTMLYENNERYEGDWKDEKDGFGTYYYPNSDIAFCYYEKGQQQGFKVKYNNKAGNYEIHKYKDDIEVIKDFPVRICSTYDEVKQAFDDELKNDQAYNKEYIEFVENKIKELKQEGKIIENNDINNNINNNIKLNKNLISANKNIEESKKEKIIKDFNNLLKKNKMKLTIGYSDGDFRINLLYNNKELIEFVKDEKEYGDNWFLCGSNIDDKAKVSNKIKYIILSKMLKKDEEEIKNKHTSEITGNIGVVDIGDQLLEAVNIILRDYLKIKNNTQELSNQICNQIEMMHKLIKPETLKEIKDKGGVYSFEELVKQEKLDPKPMGQNINI